MTTYVALLRGINVGTAKRVAMPALRGLATDLGFGDVRTHINSGNLVLTSDQSAEEVARALERGIEATFGLHSDVVVRTAERLAAVLRDNPYPDGDPSRVTVAFLAGPAPDGVEERLAALAAEDEPFTVAGLEVYVDYGHGQAGSKLAAEVRRRPRRQRDRAEPPHGREAGRPLRGLNRAEHGVSTPEPGGHLGETSAAPVLPSVWASRGRPPSRPLGRE